MIYTGPGKTESDAAVVLGNVPIPAVGIYYYEVTVVSKGRDGYISVGLSTHNKTSTKLPGIEEGTFGYFAQDGKKYNVKNASYGPTYTTGDVIGCIVDFGNRNISFTKNGILLGIAFKDFPQLLYPCVGTRTPGEIIKANFGREEFKFDITQYIREQSQKLHQQINQIQIGNITQLVLEYLVYSGYTETAKIFYETGLKNREILDESGDFNSVKHTDTLFIRNEISNNIKNGNLTQAKELLEQYYPHVIDHQTITLFSCLELVQLLQSRQYMQAIERGRVLKLQIVQFGEPYISQFMEIIELVCYVQPGPKNYILEYDCFTSVSDIINSKMVEDCGIVKIFKQLQLVKESLNSEKGALVSLLDYE
ncbi:Ran-binding protein 9 [Boothiomyces macroporosus]|uniref:Ran-binding protein 9 n=1 Tax=Boothiomyces macroporosus TaxID=261099 RepID=A0AAD5U9K3_9FUNG|nr:Ran-binding protein 9 [Boothiomyces macroporosus]